jgi:ADP-heptose:LPS heptosyltransferase
MSAANRILVYRIGQLGDTLAALPAMWAIRREFPHAHLALLTNHHPGRSRVPAESVLPGEGLFDEYIRYEIRTSTAAWNLLPVLRRLMGAKFDTLVYLAPRVRSRYQVWRDLAFFALVGIRRFVGHRGCEPLPRRVVGKRLPPVEHEADHLLRRLSLSGIPVPPPGQGSLDLRLTWQERRAACEWIKSRIPAGSENRLVAVGPGSAMPAKIWPEESYAEVGRVLAAEFDVFPVVFGGEQERALGDRLITQWGRAANAAGVLKVREAAAALSLCRLYVGNDTGTMHLAAAAGTPCVAVFSARDWPGRWYPYGPGHAVLRASVPCEGCFLYDCLEHSVQCLKQIQVADVAAACRSILQADNRQAAWSAIHTTRVSR